MVLGVVVRRATVVLVATALSLVTPAVADASPDQVTPGVTTRQAVTDRPSGVETCPLGQPFGEVLSVLGFEDGRLPAGSEGWSISTDSSPFGDRHARADILDVGNTQYARLPAHHLDGVRAPVFVTFLYRTSWAAGEVSDTGGLVWNGASRTALEPHREWTRARIELTPFTEKGTIDLSYELVRSFQDGPATFEVDDSRVYTCGSLPNARTKGDWTGEGMVDLLAITPTGDLLLYPGRGTGRFGPGIKVGVGWQGTRSLASPGDVTGNGRSDLFRLRDDGALLRYDGKGGGQFAGGLGTGMGVTWSGVEELVLPGDLNRDGRQDVLFVRPGGTLWREDLGNEPRRIGAGWSQMRLLTATADVSGDGRGDLVSVRTGDQCLYLYRGLASGALGTPTRIGCGWGAMTALSSPGDVDRDGVPDLVSRSSDGSLWLYSMRSGGTASRPGVRIGNGWNGLVHIL